MTPFHEIYGVYYRCVANILACAVQGGLTEERLTQIVRENAFQESVLTIPSALKEEQWKLINQNLQTPLRHRPSMPVTQLEKRWLKAVCLDPRCRLFGLGGPEGLEDITPLFTPSDYLVFDRYTDGDPYEDEGYIERFHTIRRAIHAGQPLQLSYENHKGGVLRARVWPVRLEYSEKDDKFRLLTSGCRFLSTVNLARIQTCEIISGATYCRGEEGAPERARLVFELLDERNALERVLLHFSHFEKSMERISERKYRVTVSYDRLDETEMVVRVLSFGPLIKATEPPLFVECIRERLNMQKSCGLR